MTAPPPGLLLVVAVVVERVEGAAAKGGFGEGAVVVAVLLLLLSGGTGEFELPRAAATRREARWGGDGDGDGDGDDDDAATAELLDGAPPLLSLVLLLLSSLPLPRTTGAALVTDCPSSVDIIMP